MVAQGGHQGGELAGVGPLRDDLLAADALVEAVQRAGGGAGAGKAAGQLLPGEGGAEGAPALGRGAQGVVGAAVHPQEQQGVGAEIALGGGHRRRGGLLGQVEADLPHGQLADQLGVIADGGQPDGGGPLLGEGRAGVGGEGVRLAAIGVPPAGGGLGGGRLGGLEDGQVQQVGEQAVRLGQGQHYGAGVGGLGVGQVGQPAAVVGAGLGGQQAGGHIGRGEGRAVCEGAAAAQPDGDGEAAGHHRVGQAHFQLHAGGDADQFFKQQARHLLGQGVGVQVGIIAALADGNGKPGGLGRAAARPSRGGAGRRRLRGRGRRGGLEHRRPGAARQQQAGQRRRSCPPAEGMFQNHGGRTPSVRAFPTTGPAILGSGAGARTGQKQ